MADMADMALDEIASADELEQRYLAGDLFLQDAIDFGIVDEHGRRQGSCFSVRRCKKRKCGESND